jgi:hypothetical protein
VLGKVKLWFAKTRQAWRNLLAWGLTRDGKGRRGGYWFQTRLAGLRESMTPDDQPSDWEPSPSINPARMKIDSTIADFDSSAIVAMERRALRQIFDHLDLAWVPGLAFVALEQTRDPVMAFKRFARWVGVDPIAARDRTDTALLRMALAIELLSELAPLSSLLSDDGDKRICVALRDSTGPDPLSRLRDQMEHVTAAAELHRIGSRMEELPSCMLASRLREIINEIMRDPLATTKHEIGDGIKLGGRLEDALRDLKAFTVEVTGNLELLHDAYLDGTLSGEHAAWCDEQRDAFERLLDEIMNDVSLGVIEVEQRVKQGEVIRDSLLMIRGRRPPLPLTPIEEIDEALAALNLARSPTLSWRAIERRCNILRKEHNTDDPDHRATPEQLQANTERMKEINNAMDSLKKHKDKLVDLMA